MVSCWFPQGPYSAAAWELPDLVQWCEHTLGPHVDPGPQGAALEVDNIFDFLFAVTPAERPDPGVTDLQTVVITGYPGNCTADAELVPGHTHVSSLTFDILVLSTA